MARRHCFGLHDAICQSSLAYGVQEAKQAAELMGLWAPIDTADALELLSPAFHNPEVRALHVAAAWIPQAERIWLTPET